VTEFGFEFLSMLLGEIKGKWLSTLKDTVILDIQKAIEAETDI